MAETQHKIVYCQNGSMAEQKMSVDGAIFWKDWIEDVRTIRIHLFFFYLLSLFFFNLLCVFFFSSICVDLLFLHGWNHDHRQFWAFHKGSSSLNWWHFKAGSFFLWEICFVECSLFSSLSGLWPLVSPLLSCNNQKPNIKYPLRGKSVPTWESLPCRLKVREEGAAIHPSFIWKDPTECFVHVWTTYLS